MKKVVLKLDLHDNKDKQKAMKTVSRLSGIDSISIDMKAQKLTVIGVVDPVVVAEKLRKLWSAEIDTVGAAKEPEKKKEEPKKDEKRKDPNEGYYPYLATQYYFQPIEENPSTCVIL